jgi:hypothetical protein
MKTGKKLILAPQQPLECDKISLGCKGGQPLSAFTWWQLNGGASIEDKQPYWGKVMGKCILAKDAKNQGFFAKQTVEDFPTPTGWAFAIPPCYAFSPVCTVDEMELGHQLSSTGVLSANIDADKLHFYKAGVLDNSSGCKNGGNNINHAVNIEGLGTDPATKTRYWIMRNSWGTKFGEAGRFRLLFGANTCGIGNFVVKVTI